MLATRKSLECPVNGEIIKAFWAGFKSVCWESWAESKPVSENYTATLPLQTNLMQEVLSFYCWYYPPAVKVGSFVSVGKEPAQHCDLCSSKVLIFCCSMFEWGWNWVNSITEHSIITPFLSSCFWCACRSISKAAHYVLHKQSETQLWVAWFVAADSLISSFLLSP